MKIDGTHSRERQRLGWKDTVRRVKKILGLSTNLRHRVYVGLFLRIRPVDDDVASPHFRAAVADPSLCYRRRLVRVVFEEGEPSILLLGIIRRTIDDYVRKTLWKQRSNAVTISVLPRPFLQGAAPCPFLATPCSFLKAEMTSCLFDQFFL